MHSGGALTSCVFRVITPAAEQLPQVRFILRKRRGGAWPLVQDAAALINSRRELKCCQGLLPVPADEPVADGLCPDIVGAMTRICPIDEAHAAAFARLLDHLQGMTFAPGKDAPHR